MSVPLHIPPGTKRLYAVMVAKADGSAITTGTVNLYVRAEDGANQGKWYRNSDSTWQATETANAMTYVAGAVWAVNLTNSPFADGTSYTLYAKESGGLHVPWGGQGACEYRPNADSNRRAYVSTGTAAGQISLSGGSVTLATATTADGTTLATAQDATDILGAIANVPENNWQWGDRSITDKSGFILIAAYDAAKTAAQPGDAMALVTGAITASKIGAGVLPANFSALGINAAGHLSRVTLADTVTTVTNRVTANADQFGGQAVTAAAPVTVPASIGTSTLDGNGVQSAMTAQGYTDQRAANLDHLDADVSDAVGVGDGDIPVDHNTGGEDALRVVHAGAGVDNARLRLYRRNDYAAGSFVVRDSGWTKSDGRWVNPLLADAGVEYALEISGGNPRIATKVVYFTAPIE